MATKEELFAAVRLIKKHCKDSDMEECICCCPLSYFCSNRRIGYDLPEEWPDPAEGGASE